MSLVAVGRAGKGPERALVERYLTRAKGLGRSHGITGFEEIELNESRRDTADLRTADEANRLLARIDRSARLILLDETGVALASRTFADRIASWRDDGVSEVVLALGGPDGHGPAARERADLVWSLGRQTMAHLLARVVVAEQLYRSVTLIANHPYHRD